MILKGSKEDKGNQFRGRGMPQIQVGVLGMGVHLSRDLQSMRVRGTHRDQSNARARARQKVQVRDPQWWGALSREGDRLVEGQGPQLACQGSTCGFREGSVETGMVGLCHTPGLTMYERSCSLRPGAGDIGDRPIVTEAQDTCGPEEIRLCLGFLGLGLCW